MKALFVIMFSVVSLVACSQDESALRKKQFNTEDGVAVSGYDVIAYFKQGKAVKGKKEFAVTTKEVTYYFSSIENREQFRKNPSAYEPHYGGWCAYAMGKKGSKVEIDPETFKIINGKLFLYYNKFFNNTLTSWNKDENNLKASADVNWQKFYR
jgi:YHS domain-containing protein